MNLAKQVLRNLAKTEISEASGELRIFNYSDYLKLITSKRALLCYLPQQIAHELKGQQTIRFSNDGLARYWPRVLNQLGYMVDVISWTDNNFVPKYSYDLYIFHGAQNYDHLKKYVSPKAKVIHFTTTTYWRFNNEAEASRVSAFEKRHKVKLNKGRFINRCIDDDSDALNIRADGIIALGNSKIRDTYPLKSKVFAINNASYPDSHFDEYRKDYSKAKNRFLFFAGAGNLHKGLDLVIEAFVSTPDLDLYIVTVREEKILKLLSRELKYPNINILNEVNMRTKEFYDSMDKCAFVILPSCSEGQAGSVVEAMNQGLIPVVSKETFLDTGDFGETLKNNSIECIKNTVERLSSLDADEVKKLSYKSRAAAVKDHSPEKFRKDLKKAIKTIIKNA